ncbi:MAG: NUDIX domain-containing protein [Solobacterium sp.]|nr:NUDIX domain-containing protein [Solobacterium sp.]
MEIWDAYNSDFEVIEGMTLIRGEENTIPQGVYHLVCDVLVRHTDGTFLLMQRDPGKAFGGMWEATAGGSALRGEAPVECAARELREETGITAAELDELRRVTNDRTHSIYVEYLCVTDCDKQSVVLQEGETAAYQWVTADEILHMSPEEFLSKRMLGSVRQMTFDDYLRETETINYSDPLIQGKAKELKQISCSQLSYIENSYRFVRDEIPHSWDIQSETVSHTAGDVLLNGTGICWTKSCLLAALLRAAGIPSGISYQYLTRADDSADKGYIIHALNTVYISELDRWIRLDARGNKENVHAEFSLEEERLAFPIRAELGERDYRDNHPDLDDRLIRILKDSRNILKIEADFQL